MKIFKTLSWIILLVLLALLAAVGFVISTQTGLNSLLALAQRVLPGELDYEDIQGRLLGPLTVRKLHYRDGQLDFNLGQAELDWKPSQLLSARLDIAVLKAQGIELQLPPPAEEEPPTEPFVLGDIRLPLQVTVDDLELQDIRVRPYGAAQPIVIDRVTLKAKTQDQRAEITTLAVSAPEGDLRLAGQLTPIDDYPLELRLEWNFRHPEYGPLTGTGTVTGAVNDTLLLRHEVAGKLSATLEGEAHNVLKDPEWAVTLDVNVPDLGLFSPDLASAELSAKLQTRGRLDDFEAGGELDTTVPELGPITAGFQLAGSTQTLRISRLTLNAADSPISLSAQGEMDLTTQHVGASGQWQDLAWPLTGTPQIASPQGKFSLQGTLQDYRAQLQASIASPELGELDASVKAEGSDRAIRTAQISLTDPDGELDLAIQGELSFADLSFSASGEWRALTWPLSGTPQVESPSGTFKASGSIKDYGFTLDTAVQGPDIPQSQWRLEGQGSDQALERLNVDGQLLEGQLQGDISAAWQPAVRWQVQLSGSGLNPGAQWPELPGELALKLRSQGQLETDGLTATLELDELSGTLSGQDVQGKAQLGVQDQDLDIQNLKLAVGNAQLEAAGRLAQNWDINWQLNIPSLGRLVPKAGGAITTSGSIQGARDKPRAEVQLAVTALAYADTRIQRLQGDAKVDLSGATRSDITLSAFGITLVGQSWGELTVAGSGNPDQHTLQSGLDGDQGSFALALQGGLEEQIWRGQLTRLEVQNPLAGSWRLEQPVSLQASAAQAAVEQTCLSSPPTRVCIQGQWDAETGAGGELKLEQLTADRFAALLPDNIEVDTSISGEATGSSHPDGRFQGKVDIQLKPGGITLSVEGKPVKIALNGGQLQAEASQDDAGGQLRVDLGELAQVAADVRIKDPLGQASVAGEVNAAINDLSLVSVFVPQLDNVAGQLAADLDLAGALPVPAIRGEVRLKDAAADVPEINVRIEDIQLAAASDGQGPSQITGAARSGAGRLDLSGQVDVAETRLRLNLKGEDFQAVNTDEIQLLIAPDLNLEVAPGMVRADGQVVIPRASISPPSNTGPGGVAPSQDVVIVREADGSEVEEETTAGLDIFARIRVILGEDVTIRAAGLAAELSGELLVEQAPQLSPRGTGSIAIAEGQYRVFGKNLEIQRGRVLFSGSPLDNPGLDLRVARSIEDVTVGAQVTGTIRQPSLTLFSNPAMSDNSILSYLLFDRAPDSQSGSENALLMRTALALGAGGGNVLTQRIAQGVGLDQLSFEGDAGNAALTIGKYLAPGLYVSYGLGLFDAVSTFNMRYRISERFSLESSVNGTSSGADLIYSFER